mgnify:CR=1 FL=1
MRAQLGLLLVLVCACAPTMAQDLARPAAAVQVPLDGTAVTLPAVDAGARAQVRLGIGLQAEAALGHRRAQAYGGEHVVQHLARAHVHDHVAGGHEWHTGAGRGFFQLGEPQVVVQTVQQFGCEPEI